MLAVLRGRAQSISVVTGLSASALGAALLWRGSLARRRRTRAQAEAARQSATQRTFAELSGRVHRGVVRQHRSFVSLVGGEATQASEAGARSPCRAAGAPPAPRDRALQ